MKRRLVQATSWLESPRLPWVLGVLAALLLLPSLSGGFQLDDHFQRFRLLGLGDDPLQLFVFYDGDVEANQRSMDQGLLPWWANPEIRHANFRYLSVLTMMLDYLLWPNSPWMMHLHSLVWLALAVGAATALYRHLFDLSAVPLWAGGVAALLYAVDDAHSLPTAYLANRNALICTFFGLAAVLLHSRWREGQRRVAACLAPVCLGLALTAGELGVSAVAFLVSYALFLDAGSWKHRVLSLLPAGLVTAAWLTLHRLGGFGSEGSGFYLDPLREPLDFLFLLSDRALMLMLGQWTPFPSDWSTLVELGTSEALPLRIAALVVCGALLVLFARLLLSDRLSRFFAAGSLAALLPISAVGPQDRLLFFVGFGAMGLIGRLVAVAMERGRGRTLRWTAGVLVFLHLVVSPPVAYAFLYFQNDAARRMERAAESIVEPELADHTLVLINPPDSIYTVLSVPMMRANAGLDIPHRLRALAHGTSAMTLTRVAENRLVLELEEGLFPDTFSRYFRSQSVPLRPNETVSVEGMAATVEKVREGEGPSRVSFEFDVSLDDQSLLWRSWNGSVYVPWEPPPVGEIVRIDAQRGIFG